MAQGQRGVVGVDSKGAWGITFWEKEMLSDLIVVDVTQVYTFVRTHITLFEMRAFYFI